MILNYYLNCNIWILIKNVIFNIEFLEKSCSITFKVSRISYCGGFGGQRTDIKSNIEIKNENLLKVLTHAKGSYSSISTTISHIWIVNLHFGVTATALAHVIVSFQIFSSKIDQGRTVRVRASDFRRMK